MTVHITVIQANEENPERKTYPRRTYKNAGTYNSSANKGADDSAKPTERPVATGTPIPNKYLIAVLAILIAFAIIASAIIVSFATGDKNSSNSLPTANPGAATSSPDTQNSGDVDYPLY